MLSLYAYALGSYATGIIGATDSPMLKHGMTSIAILLLTGLNVMGSRAVGRAEFWIVLVKVAILVFFVAVGAKSIQVQRLAPDTWSSMTGVIAGSMLVFLAYEGFELIANTAESVRNPGETLPRAYAIAVIFVLILYVCVAAVTVGNLPIKEIVDARDYALAEAARPFLGMAGFTLISVAAVLSTGSALNATLYGSARISFIIAKHGELPEFLEHKIWKRPIEGLLITAAATLVVANLFNLSSIALLGSAGFLIIFAMVNAANAKLAEETESMAWLSWVGVVCCTVALAVLLWKVGADHPHRLLVLAGMIGISLLVETVYRAFSRSRQQNS
jgi:amino acid transporter